VVTPPARRRDHRVKEATMPQFLLLNYLPVDGGPPADEAADQHQRWQRFAQDLVDAGMLISNTGLKGPDAATTVRIRGGETQITDGPFAETKEYLAGYFLIEAPDLDAALKHAEQMPSATWGSVEVRPSWG
jgi:hypothetical protein